MAINVLQMNIEKSSYSVMHRDYIKNKEPMNSAMASPKKNIKINEEKNVCNFDFVKLFARPFLLQVSWNRIWNSLSCFSVWSGILVIQRCSGYYYSTASFNKAWTQFLCRFKSPQDVSEILNHESLWQ